MMKAKLLKQTDRGQYDVLQARRDEELGWHGNSFVKAGRTVSPAGADISFTPPQAPC
jgi:hypothetical protein